MRRTRLLSLTVMLVVLTLLTAIVVTAGIRVDGL